MPATPADEAGPGTASESPPVERLLAHPVRRAIAEYIAAHPGADLAEVTRAVGAGWGNVHHHVERLRRAGHVAVVREGHHARLFLTDAVTPGERMRSALLANVAVRVVFDAIAEHPGIIQRDLAKELGVTPTAVRKVVRRLTDNGIVHADRTGKEVHYAVLAATPEPPSPDTAKNLPRLPPPGP